VTRRKRLHPKRLESTLLDANVEMIAVAWVGWWIDEAAAMRSWWQGIAAAHGDRLRDKWRAAAPGTRPAFDWITRLPPWPLLSAPDTFESSRAVIEVGGKRYWYCGEPWQRSQVEILRECGEVDAAEYREHLAWVRRGAPCSYTLDEGWACTWLECGITRKEIDDE
jgi:hypothetical protein